MTEEQKIQPSSVLVSVVCLMLCSFGNGFYKKKPKHLNVICYVFVSVCVITTRFPFLSIYLVILSNHITAIINKYKAKDIVVVVDDERQTFVH